jgi:hypothetical protein
MPRCRSSRFSSAQATKNAHGRWTIGPHQNASHNDSPRKQCTRCMVGTFNIALPSLAAPSIPLPLFFLQVGRGLEKAGVIPEAKGCYGIWGPGSA